MERFKRVFVVVMDSLGVGAMPDSADFGDIGVNTLGHISESVDTFKIPNLQKLGMANIIPLKQVSGKRASNRILWKASGDQPWQGYHDRTLGDDGSGSNEAV